jgi:hypothetical protein
MAFSLRGLYMILYLTQVTWSMPCDAMPYVGMPESGDQIELETLVLEYKDASDSS